MTMNFSQFPRNALALRQWVANSIVGKKFVNLHEMPIEILVPDVPEPILVEVGTTASETTASILAKLDGAANVANKIGAEYLPPEWFAATVTAAAPGEFQTSTVPTAAWWDHVVVCAYDVYLPVDASEYEGKKFMLRTEAAISIAGAYSNGSRLFVIPAPSVAFGVTHTLIESIGGIWMATLNYSGVPAGGSSTAANVSYSNSTSGLTADDVQLAIDEVVVSLNAIASAKQPIDSDLTAYANAADAASRRALIGSVSIADITAANFTGTLPVSKGGTGATAASVGTGGVLLGNQAVSTGSGVTFATVNGGTLSGNNSGNNSGDNAVNSLYSGLVTNQTHTGDATGSGALTVRGINGVLMSGLATGITKNTTGTGAPSIAVAGDFPTLNQSTTGNAATVTTNANLTGHITSVGNATSLGSFTLAQLSTAVSDADIARTDAGQTFAGNHVFSGNLSVTGNTTVADATETTVALGTVATTATIAITAGTLITATLTASTACVFTMPAVAAGKSFTLLLKQATTTGNGSATFTGVKWASGTAPVITATASKMDILTFVSDGASWYGSIAQNFTP